MDHSEGVQIPQGLLPSVSVLKPGLALLLKHSQVDIRFIDSHIEQLNEGLPNELYPSFSAYDCSATKLEFVSETLSRYRQAALVSNRLQFVVSPFFAPRLQTLIELADHVFYYGSGITGPVLMPAKINGQVLVGQHFEVLAITRRVKRPEDRYVLQITLPPGVSADEACFLVSDALARRFTGHFDVQTRKADER